MNNLSIHRKNERGATILEYAIAATVMMISLFAVLEFGRALWTHNALNDAVRRGARYAVNKPSASAADVQRVVVYGNPAGGEQPVVNGLGTGNVTVKYSGAGGEPGDAYGLAQGTVSVSITGYQFRFAIPLVGTTITMPSYKTTLPAENAGLIPASL